MKYLRLGRKGDTLIEVTLALALLSLIIGAAYTISSRAQKGSQITQDRAEALKLAESQIEIVREWRRSSATGMQAVVGTTATPAGIAVAAYDSPFCLTITPATASSNIIVTPRANAASNASCRQGTAGRYLVSVSRRVNTFNDNTRGLRLSVDVTWDGPGNTGPQRVNQVAVLY